MRGKGTKILSAALSSLMVVSSFGGWIGAQSSNVWAASPSALSTEEFASPGKSYQPGVRWWWSGGAVEADELIREIDFLAQQNIGFVEINPFFIDEVDPADEGKKASIYTPEFYELLDVAITAAEEKGIVVDLNMGSGWNANSQFVELGDSMGNMALGRVTISGDDYSVADSRAGASPVTRDDEEVILEDEDTEEVPEQEDTEVAEDILDVENEESFETDDSTERTSSGEDLNKGTSGEEEISADSHSEEDPLVQEDTKEKDSEDGESEVIVTDDELSPEEDTERASSRAGALSGINIPDAEKSIFYYGDRQKGEWDESEIQLQGILVAELTGEKGTKFEAGSSMFGPIPAFNEFADSQGNTKEYGSQVEINPENSVYVDAADVRIEDGILNLNDDDIFFEAGKEYEVIALYYLPSGAKGIDCATDWFVLDHLDGQKTAEYINEWLGDSAMSQILDRHDNIRAVFNDSYEFYSDVYYTKSLYDLAGNSVENGLGYDFTKYLPTVYKEYSAAPFYMGLGTKNTFLTYTLNQDEQGRIMYDYNTLIASKFAEGMEGFQSAANQKGLKYRQEAYNPPIDTLGAAAYVDIPEGEQGNEMSLIRVSSGAHLYNRNLVTCEQYTLGCTPFKNTLEQVKIGYDNMATSGVNNFFYHGFNYLYGKDTETYGENGWSPMSGIGINVSEMNTLSSYFPEMNLYAGRVNYLMQQGSASKDVALYMSFNGSLSETDAVKAMNYNGIAWDAINDASIQAFNTVYQDGKIYVNGGNMEYDSILVETEKIPVETMEKLKDLAAQGANIIFYGNAPETQPGYADGEYAQKDAQVAAISGEMIGMAGVSNPQTMEELENALTASAMPEVTYSRNENVRFSRRTLSDGGELVYIRNISDTENTITVNVGNQYENCYWLDQNTGEIYPAEVKDGSITVKMNASTDTYSGKHSMALALLCEPQGVEINTADLTQGAPDTISEAIMDESFELKMESLTVTADNLDGVIGGDEETVVYTDQILGKWNDGSFHGGALQKVVADGIYKTSYTLEKGVTAEQAVLKLSGVYTAATVYVNGEEVGKLMYAPYELDIASFLSEGKNEIEIAVTPRKMNRYYNTQNGQYSSSELLDSGMEGPVMLDISKSAAGPGESEKESEKETEKQTEKQTESKEIKVEKVTLNKSKVDIFVKETISLKAQVTPSGAKNKSLNWTSSNSSVAKVDGNGKVTALKAGTTTITATAKDGSKASGTCKITVVKPVVKLNVKTAKLQVKKSTKVIKASGLKKGDSILKWTSSKKSVATVDKKGKIKAKKAGKTKITVYTKKGAKASMTLTVTKKAVKTKSIKANVKRLTLKKGKTYKLSITRKPITAVDKITYSSSKKSVVLVSKSGKITARKKGTAVIRIKTSNNKKTTVKVTVK